MVAISAAVVWTNVTLYQIIPTTLALSTVPTATADMWLADAFLAAYYDLRGRYGPMACRDPIARNSEFCSEYTEIMPRGDFAVRQVVIEANLASQPSNGGWGNYSTCGLSDDRKSYSCFCGAGCDCGCDCGDGCGCDCNGLPNTIGRCPSHGFSTQGTSLPYGDWHSLFAQKGAGTSHWYDTLAAGGCAGGVLSPACTWRVAKFVKATNLSCHANMVDAAVEQLPQMKSCLREQQCSVAPAQRGSDW
jgi:hypothetical protein